MDTKPNIEQRWDELSFEWEKNIGDEGDSTRRNNSDPLLWSWIGACAHQRKEDANFTVLDAGCGTGYLSVKLAQQGFSVIGVDVSANQLGFAQQRITKNGLEKKVILCKESVENMTSVQGNSIDLLISNFVLMDLEKYSDAIKEFHRVLKISGKAIVIFLHPCFDANDVQKTSDGSKVLTWPGKGKPQNYFQEYLREWPWGAFPKPFFHYHRPLSSYWKAFTENGFNVIQFEEIGKFETVPDAVAFMLEKKM